MFSVYCMSFFKDVFDTCDVKMLSQVNDTLATSIIKFYLP